MWNMHVGRRKINLDDKKKKASFSGDIMNMFFGVGEMSTTSKKVTKAIEPIRGEDVETQIDVSIYEAFFGMEKKISLRTINGKMKTFTVKIPAGVAEGMQVTMNGKGNAGKHNGVAGDLLVLIEEEKHPELIRDESDLIYNLLLSVPTAALGGTVEIPTIDGKAKIKIEPGTQPGKVLRLRGKGLPNINSYGYSTGTGDLLVNVSVYIPESLTKEERQALEKWQESESFKPDMSLKEKIFKKFRSLFD